MFDFQKRKTYIYSRTEGVCFWSSWVSGTLHSGCSNHKHARSLLFFIRQRKYILILKNTNDIHPYTNIIIITSRHIKNTHS